MQAPPSGIAKELIDEVAETVRADNTSHPLPLLVVSLLAANKPYWRVALDPDRDYLENCATFNQAMNPDILTNIFESLNTLFAHCNSGTTAINTNGILGSLEFWLNENRIANLLSIPELTRIGHTIT